MEMESCVPPGFRFHPTEEELVGYYLQRKVNSLKIDLNVIVDIDLYRMEPWDIIDKCRLGYEEQSEWYFFSHKDRKYPTGTRTNRATAAGFWKATGRDKAVLSKEKIIGMRKTLVFYKGRAPNGRKTDWIMHEYRLQTFEHGPVQEEGWVVCRAFRKPSPSHHKQGFEALMNPYYRPPPSMADIPSSPMHTFYPINQATNIQQFSFPPDQQELTISNHASFENSLLEIPQLDSPTISTSLVTKDGLELNSTATNEHLQDYNLSNCYSHHHGDWNVFDKLISANSIEPQSQTYQNFPILPDDYELNIQNPESHLLGCFSDL